MPLSRKVWEFMVKEPPTVAPTDSIRKAMKVLHSLQKDVPGVQSMIVADAQTGQLKGVVTLRRILEGLRKAVGSVPGSSDLAFWERPEVSTRLRQEAELVKVKDVYSKHIYQVKAYDSVARALELMLDRKIRGVPVVEGQKVIGVIRLADIIKQLHLQIVGD